MCHRDILGVPLPNIHAMSIAARIEQKLAEALQPDHLDVINESGNHNVPPGAESHFKVVVVAAVFAGQRLLNRHRQINTLLAEELAGEVHALSIHAYTQEEWRRRFGNAPLSPPCLGGKRLEGVDGAAGQEPVGGETDQQPGDGAAGSEPDSGQMAGDTGRDTAEQLGAARQEPDSREIRPEPDSDGMAPAPGGGFAG